MIPDFDLKEKGKYASWLEALRIDRFQDLISHVGELPYGRTSDRADFTKVLEEKRGSCSGKHALLAELAEMNGQTEIELLVGIFLMDENYAPSIGPVLQAHDLECIPEAHCYLRYQGKRYDFTTKQADVARFEHRIVREQRCEPQQVVEWKPAIHRHYLAAWGKRNQLKISEEELWEIRERCIAAL
ncbi:MAG: hypothetical protein EP338_01995 [Bacteroidetes bacterium]|nr:MAG: hypothetical protein EP338_01995 [Bacteroidota bacterium]